MSRLKGAVVGAVAGLAIGYCVFGQVNGHLVPIGRLLFAPQGWVENFEYWALGLGEIRRWVLLSALLELDLGLLCRRREVWPSTNLERRPVPTSRS